MYRTAVARRDDGFTLVELVVVMMVISVLVAIGMASYSRMTRIADDEAAQLDLVTAVKVQMLHHLDNGAFTSDAGVLQALEPTLVYSADGADRTIVVEVEPAHSQTDVCLFVETRSGSWFGLHHSVDGGHHYGLSAPLACTPANVAGWSSSPW